MRLRRPDTWTAQLDPARRRWVTMLVENESYPADVRVRSEAETLLAAGWRVTVIAPAEPGQPRREHLDGVEVVRFRMPETSQSVSGFILEYAIAHVQLTRLALAHLLAGVDVLHVNNPPDTLGCLLVLARLLGRRTVFDNHDLFPELFELRYGSPRVTRFLRVFQRLAFREADLVLTTNESQRELVIDAVGRDPETVIVVRNGPRSGTLPGPSGSPEEPPRSAQAPLQLLFVGALEPQDGAVALAQVLSVIVDRHGLDARLIVVGSGSCRAPLEMECERLGVGQRIAFTGRVPHEEVPGLLARADVCVDPAPCNELNHRSTMIKIAEYMAAGKPIVAFDLRETRRTAGAAALYAACGDVEGFAARIVEIASSQEVRRELTRAAETRLPELLWEHSAEALLGAYRTLLES